VHALLSAPSSELSLLDVLVLVLDADLEPRPNPQILGWTCLVGLGVMALALPINHVLVKRRLRIHRKMLASRDARMEILNELFQAIRFIKYSGDEESWLGRVFAARKTELDWLLKTRMNNLAINALWNFSPDLVRPPLALLARLPLPLLPFMLSSSSVGVDVLTLSPSCRS